MRLLFKQRLFSWFDSYDIYDQQGKAVYTVRGQLSWGHCLKIYDSMGREVGTVRERIFSWMPRFELYLGERYMGCISRELTLFRPRYRIDCMGWQVQGDFMEWDYTIHGSSGACIASVSKELFNWTDTYVLDVFNPADALMVLMFVLAMDAEKCSRNKN